MSALTVRVADLPKAKRVEFIEPDGKRYVGVVLKAHYAGHNISRLRERNKITTLFGLPNPGPEDFWSFDCDDGTGFFLGDLLADCAKGRGQLLADGRPVEVQKDVRFEGSFMTIP